MNTHYIEDISLKGFIVVKHQLFERERLPTMTLFSRKVSFSRECHDVLDGCESIQIMVNYEHRQIIVKPSASSDEDSLVWRNDKLKNPNVGDIGCPLLTLRLYKEWKLNPRYRYKTQGKLVKSDRKLMILFDFNSADTYEGIKLVERHA